MKSEFIEYDDELKNDKILANIYNEYADENLKKK
jgi:hypothetical protein